MRRRNHGGNRGINDSGRWPVGSVVRLQTRRLGLVSGMTLQVRQDRSSAQPPALRGNLPSNKWEDLRASQNRTRRPQPDEGSRRCFPGIGDRVNSKVVWGTRRTDGRMCRDPSVALGRCAPSRSLKMTKEGDEQGYKKKGRTPTLAESARVGAASVKDGVATSLRARRHTCRFLARPHRASAAPDGSD